MGIREIAARDCQAIHESESGFAWPIVVIDPDGDEHPMTGLSTDIHLTIDPTTGQTVSGRQASVSISTRTLSEAGIPPPTGVVRRTARPWTVRFDDISGVEHTFKVAESYPDQAIGSVVLRLEGYGNA